MSRAKEQRTEFTDYIVIDDQTVRNSLVHDGFFKFHLWLKDGTLPRIQDYKDEQEWYKDAVKRVYRGRSELNLPPTQYDDCEPLVPRELNPFQAARDAKFQS